MAITRRRFSRIAAAATGALFAPALIGRAQAAQPVLVASLLGPDKPETMIWHRIRDLVDAELPGAFNFNIVPNAALGAEREVAEAIKLGAVQASLLTVSALSGWVPETQLLDLPFLFRDAAHLDRVVRSPLGDTWRALLRDQGFTAADWVNYGARHLLAKEEILIPQQMSGKRIRVIQSPLHAELWKAYGALPTAIPITEAYGALATGVVDAMDLTIAAYAGFKLYEVVPWLIQTGHIWASGVVCFSSAFWDGLPAEQQVVLAGAVRQGAQDFNAMILEEERRARAVAIAAGGHLVDIADRTSWEDGAHRTWTIMADQLGGMDHIEQTRAL